MDTQQRRDLLFQEVVRDNPISSRLPFVKEFVYAPNAFRRHLVVYYTLLTKETPFNNKSFCLIQKTEQNSGDYLVVTDKDTAFYVVIDENSAQPTDVLQLLKSIDTSVNAYQVYIKKDYLVDLNIAQSVKARAKKFDLDLSFNK